MLVLLLAATTACAADPPPTAAPPEAVGDLRQFRSDASRRVLQVTLKPRVAVAVTGLRLEVEGFEPAPASPQDVELPAGGIVDLPAAYGDAQCPGTPGAARAVVTLAAGRELVVPLADRGLVARLHADECADRALASQVSFTVDPAMTTGRREGRPALQVVVRARRTAGEDPVTVTGLGGHIVFSVRSPVTTTPLVTLGAADREAELPLELVPTRCDGHALAENKRAGLLGVYVALGAGEPRLVTVVPAPAVQSRLADFAVEGCRAAG